MTENNTTPTSEKKANGTIVPMSDKDYERRKNHKPTGKSSRADSADMWPLRPIEQRLKRTDNKW